MIPEGSRSGMKKFSDTPLDVRKGTAPTVPYPEVSHYN